MKLFLKQPEKDLLKQNGSTQIERECYLPAPASSIVHGVGNKCLFDKIDYRWVYGDTEDYIQKMKSVGRRGTEYIYGPNKDRNQINGGCWYDCHKQIDEFGEPGKIFSVGTKNKISYKITSFTATLRKPEDSQYQRIVLAINVEIVN